MLWPWDTTISPGLYWIMGKLRPSRTIEDFSWAPAVSSFGKCHLLRVHHRFFRMGICYTSRPSALESIWINDFNWYIHFCRFHPFPIHFLHRNTIHWGDKMRHFACQKIAQSLRSSFAPITLSQHQLDDVGSQCQRFHGSLRVIDHKIS